jgi:arylsulfatase A-like enzyme
MVKREKDMGAKGKNVLLLLTDQQRMDSLGVYGAELAEMPVLDALAQRGTRFTQAYTPCSVCSPARASLFSGLYPHQHEVTRNGGIYRRELPNIAQALRQADYRLGYTGKWHIDDTYGPTHFGFEANDWLGYSYPASGVYARFLAGTCLYPINHYVEYLKERDLEIPELTDAIYRPANRNMEIYGRQTGPVEASFEHYVAEEAIELIDRFAARGEQDGRPFFIWVNFWGPHDPYVLPEPFYSMFDDKEIGLSASMEEAWEKKPWIQQKMCTNYWGIEDLEESIWRKAIAKYAAYCAFLDWETGRILDHLEARGVLDDTVVVYSSDHGSMIGHHKLIDKGPYAYDDIQRIPLIAAGPGISQGNVCDEFVYLHDLTPTIVEWAGAEAFPRSNAQSLVPAMEGESLSRPRKDVFMTRHHHPFPYEQRFVRTERYKYAFNACDIDELYDLETDPHEMVNRIDDPAYASVKAELIERMWAHLTALDDPISQCFNVWTGRETTFSGMPDEEAKGGGDH